MPLAAEGRIELSRCCAKCGWPRGVVGPSSWLRARGSVANGGPQLEIRVDGHASSKRGYGMASGLYQGARSECFEQGEVLLLGRCPRCGDSPSERRIFRGTRMENAAGQSRAAEHIPYSDIAKPAVKTDAVTHVQREGGAVPFPDTPVPWLAEQYGPTEEAAEEHSTKALGAGRGGGRGNVIAAPMYSVGQRR